MREEAYRKWAVIKLVKDSAYFIGKMDIDVANETIEETVIKLISQTLDVSEITLESSIQNTMEWDSLNHLRILNVLETEFNCTMKLEEISEVRSVKDWIDLISKYNEEL